MTETRPRLSDAFIDLLRLVVEFRTGRTAPVYDRLRDDVLTLLNRGETAAREAGHSDDDIAEARYAVCAWIDESILDSSWEQRTRWQRDLLQRAYYQSSDAGERFFARLAALDKSRRAVREVYYLCLVLGFRGRYAFDLPALERLKTTLLASLFGGGVEPPTLEKSGVLDDPAAGAVPVAPPTPPASWTKKILFASPALLVLVLWAVFRWTLAGVSDDILRVGWPQ